MLRTLTGRLGPWKRLAVGLAVVLGLAGAPPARAAIDPVDARIAADAAKRGTSMSDRLFGIFFEDINHGADGGLYPELVQNRSFEFGPIDNPGNGAQQFLRGTEI